MVKLKTVLDTRRAKADGSFSVLFRITNHKDVKYITSGLSLSQECWDERTSSLNKNHPNAGSLNSFISKRFYEIQKAIVGLEEVNQYSFKSLKSVIVGVTAKIFLQSSIKVSGIYTFEVTKKPFRVS